MVQQVLPGSTGNFEWFYGDPGVAGNELATLADITGSITVVADEAARLALTPEPNDFVLQRDTNILYYWDTASDPDAWVQVAGGGLQFEDELAEAIFLVLNRKRTHNPVGTAPFYDSEDLVLNDNSTAQRTWRGTAPFFDAEEYQGSRIEALGAAMHPDRTEPQALLRTATPSGATFPTDVVWSFGNALMAYVVMYLARSIRITGGLGTENIVQNGRTVTFPDAQYTVNGRDVDYTPNN